MLIIIEKTKSLDGSIKYLFQNEKGYKFESIYYRLPPKKGVPYTIYHMCISTQAGCAMGCSFCATGYGGFFDQLTPEDMLEEVNLVREDILQEGKEDRVTQFNIVLMGMGEPFMNYENVCKFCYLAKEKIDVLYKIAVSTVGVAPRIVDFAKVALDIDVRLFISVHSPYNEQRAEIMPITKKYSIEESLDACRTYSKITKSSVTASYLLLEGINDSDEHARSFAKLLDPKHFDAQILLYNNTPGIPFKRPEDARGYQFGNILSSYGVDTIVQISKGRDVNGGCGQLLKEVNERLVRRKRERGKLTCVEGSYG